MAHLFHSQSKIKIPYEPEVDILTILLSNAASEQSYEANLGIVLDYDAEDNLVGLEILNASKYF